MLDLTDLIGVPYKEAGRDPKAGLDCYGLLIVVFGRFGIILPDVPYSCVTDEIISAKTAEYKPLWEEIPTPIVPCAVAIRNRPPFVNHVGVYIGDGRFLHCLRGVGVHQSRIYDLAWKNRIEGYFVPRREGVVIV